MNAVAFSNNNAPTREFPHGFTQINNNDFDFCIRHIEEDSAKALFFTLLRFADGYANNRRTRSFAMTASKLCKLVCQSNPWSQSKLRHVAGLLENKYGVLRRAKGVNNINTWQVLKIDSCNVERMRKPKPNRIQAQAQQNPGASPTESRRAQLRAIKSSNPDEIRPEEPKNEPENDSLKQNSQKEKLIENKTTTDKPASEEEDSVKQNNVVDIFEKENLSEQLSALGINNHKVKLLLEEYKLSFIKEQLEILNLQKNEVENPAGFIVSALTTGGYTKSKRALKQEEKARRAALTPEEREAEHEAKVQAEIERRKKEEAKRLQEEEQKEKAYLEKQAALEQRFLDLDEQAKDRILKLSQKYYQKSCNSKFHAPGLEQTSERIIRELFFTTWDNTNCLDQAFSACSIEAVV